MNEEKNTLAIGDIVQMKKGHPCGENQWKIIRVGADIKIRCLGCARIVMMDRADFIKRVSKWLHHESGI